MKTEKTFELELAIFNDSTKVTKFTKMDRHHQTKQAYQDGLVSVLFAESALLLNLNFLFHRKFQDCLTWFLKLKDTGLMTFQFWQI